MCRTAQALGWRRSRSPPGPPATADRLVARSLRFTPEAVFFSPRLGPEVEVQHIEITALLRGLHVSHEQGVRTETERKFTSGKAILTQGLVMTTTEKREVKFEAQNAEQFLYVYGGSKTVAIYESEVAFTCLGADVAAVAAREPEPGDERGCAPRRRAPTSTTGSCAWGTAACRSTAGAPPTWWRSSSTRPWTTGCSRLPEASAYALAAIDLPLAAAALGFASVMRSPSETFSPT